MRLRSGIPCSEMVELVTDYLEGALSWRERRRFERHIAGCEHCRAYLEQMRETLRVLGRLDEETIAPEARDALLHAFRDWSAEAR
jgi:anti-sigma factor RsiW